MRTDVVAAQLDMCSMFRVHVLNGRCQCVTENVKLIAIAISIARARAITVAWMDMQSARKKMCSKNLWWARCVCEYQSPSCFCTLFANFPVYAFGYSIGYFQLHFSLLYVLFCATKKKETKNSNNTKSAHFLCHSSVANVCAMIEMFWPRFFFAPTTNIANAVGCQYLFWFDC